MFNPEGGSVPPLLSSVMSYCQWPPPRSLVPTCRVGIAETAEAAISANASTDPGHRLLARIPTNMLPPSQGYRGRAVRSGNWRLAETQRRASGLPGATGERGRPARVLEVELDRSA